MADRQSPAELNTAEADYNQKFNKSAGPEENLKKQESTGGDTTWKTTATAKSKKKSDDPAGKKGRFRFAGRRSGKLRKGSAFAFIIGFILAGVWYTSVFAPNILLVHIKDMYANDLSDSTVALNAYYWKMLNYKMNRADCGDKKSIKCKLTTMSRAQKTAFEKHGFTVIGTKVTEDNQDDGQGGNNLPQSRYQVSAILPPNYKQVIDDIKLSGLSWLSGGLNGNLSQLTDRLSGDAMNIAKDAIPKNLNSILDYAPLATGDMVWLYAQLSDANKAQIYSVFNPKTSYYMDARFKQVLRTRYNQTKTLTVSGTSEAQVNKSFDNAVQNSGGGIDPLTGGPDLSSGISLGSLANPASALTTQTAANAMALNTYDYVGLECSWYSTAKQVTNNAKSAKAATVARYALQYLKAADAIKSGQSQEVPSNVLSSKLAASVTGDYGGPNATNSSMYQSIVYGNLPIPSLYGFLYYLDTFDLIGAMIPAWSQLMVSATGLGGVTGASGTLTMPPANLTGNDRDYCLSGEPYPGKQELKGQSTDDTRCPEAITAMAPPGTQGLVSEAIEIARRTCPPVNANDDFVKAILGDWRGPISNVILPSQKLVQATLTPYIAGLFSVNAIAWAAAESFLFTSSLKGVPASDAIFAGTGQVLGDMAMSRGLEPGNAITMPIYMVQKQNLQNSYDQVARYNAKQNQLDPYNKFSFLGSIVNTLSPTTANSAPLMATLANGLSLFGSAAKSIGTSAGAVLYLQPDPFNPLRLNCPDPEYLAIGIMADTACNVRYALGPQEMLAQPDSVLDYMQKSHPDLTNDNIQELEERLAKTAGDPEPGVAANITRMLDDPTYGVRTASNKPMIDKETGKATPGSEYEKYLTYCVDRTDPWGRSGVVTHTTELSADEKRKRAANRTKDDEAVSTDSAGSPYQKYPGIAYPSITEGAKADQDWYTGKKCLDQSEELMNFRAYTLMCSVDGTLAGSTDCTEDDNADSIAYSDDFYTSNDILFSSWN